jgi:serine/threonine protein phosphatase PrpC
MSKPTILYQVTLPSHKHGHRVPPEDSFSYDDKIFAIADGITRDPTYHLDFRKKIVEKIFEKHYPNPSGARVVADIFCKTFIATIKLHQTTKKAFLIANKNIASYNKHHLKKVDYLVNDLYGCTAVGAYIKGKKLYWSVIGDSGVAVFNCNGRLKYRSLNSVAIFEKYVANGKIKFNWNTTAGRKSVRSQYRNNPNMKIGKVCVSYGALTGENNAESFIYSDKASLQSGDLIILFTDGFASYLDDKKFVKILLQKSSSSIDQKMLPYSLSKALLDDDRFGKERTLIAVRV